MIDDPFNLERFLKAQETAYEHALDELLAGYKQSHWMWFILPQLRALGRSSTARFYGLESLNEAKAYWQHPTLGSRLRKCFEAILGVNDKSAAEVLGEVDALKFRSCLTLFREVAPSDHVIQAALARFYAGQPDMQTLRLLLEQGGEA